MITTSALLVKNGNSSPVFSSKPWGVKITEEDELGIDTDEEEWWSPKETVVDAGEIEGLAADLEMNVEDVLTRYIANGDADADTDADANADADVDEDMDEISDEVSLMDISDMS